MTPTPRFEPVLRACGLVVSGWFALSGCSALHMEAPANPMEAAKVVPSDRSQLESLSATQCVVEVRKDGAKEGKRQIVEVGPTTTVTEAMKQVGATKAFKRMKIDLVRKLPNGGSHKMPIEWDNGHHSVAPQNDYHMHPGDRLIVHEDPSTFIDDMMKQSPLSFMNGK